MGESQRRRSFQRQVEYVTAYLGGPETYGDWCERVEHDELPGEHDILEAGAVALSVFVETHAARQGEAPEDTWSRFCLMFAAEDGD